LALITKATADASETIKVWPQKFILEIYEDGVKRVDRYLYGDLQILSDKGVEWTTIFLDGSHRCIEKDTALHVPVVTRWDKAIRDVKYDENSFQLKLVFPFGNEEVLVRGTRIQNSPDFKIEGIGFRKDLSTSKTVKIEWKSVPVDRW
jgi:hypothetical protein